MQPHRKKDCLPPSFEKHLNKYPVINLDDADSAIDQILRRQYTAKVAQHIDNLLLVGINYDKETKTHTCPILHG